MKLNFKQTRIQHTLITIIIFLVSYLVYATTINLGFFSDDFVVIHRLIVMKQFWAPGFFRPISDLSLLLNYKAGGLSETGYRIFNIGLHALNSWLLFKLLLNLRYFEQPLNFRVSLLAAFLFCLYPFHGESIIWIVGRGSLLATTLGICSLYIYTLPVHSFIKHTCAGICFFLSLASYESVMVLPGILFLASYFINKKFITAIKFSLPFMVIGVTNLIARKWVAGIIVGNYGIDMFNDNLAGYLARYAKSIGRLAIPGMHNSLNFTIALFVFILFIAISFVVVYRIFHKHFRAYTMLWLMLAIGQLIPGIFGVDTHNQDGERMLYFPSIFFCTVIAFLLVLFTQSKKTLLAITSLVGIIFLMEINRLNQNWVIADKGIKNIIRAVGNASSKNETVYIANIPELHEGSFMFRNGFYEALTLSGIDTSNIVALNYLLKEDLTKHTALIEPMKLANRIDIYPRTSISDSTIYFQNRFPPYASESLKIIGKSHFFFWNKATLIQLF